MPFWRHDETFKCTICDETLPSKSDFMLHRKQHHSEMVQECKNGDKCVWHRNEKIFSRIDNNKTNEENYKNEKLFKKLEDMIEKLNVKVEKIEKWQCKETANRNLKRKSTKSKWNMS